MVTGPGESSSITPSSPNLLVNLFIFLDQTPKLAVVVAEQLLNSVVRLILHFNFSLQNYIPIIYLGAILEKFHTWYFL